SGTPIFPQDPYERAIARFWAKFIDDKCVPAIWKACFGKGEEQEKAIEEAKEHLKTLENEVKGKKFFCGESIGVVDIVANFIGLWTGVFQEVKGVELLTKDKYPKLIEWSDEYLKCSIIKEKLPPRDELSARLRSYFK
ncbi:glutathione S-transferase family protein, partial [Mycobacterium kansasii]